MTILIEDIEKGEMHVADSGAYSLGETKKRHGGVLQITDGEFLRLILISH